MPRKVNNLFGLATLWQALHRGWFRGYRPERHYMRGRGPAWHAKHLGA